MEVAGMAKTIKFNLICDNNPIRTLEDLQNHFSIEDILAYYNNKLLHRWLDVRGYTEELDKVSAITSEKSIEIAKQLIEIFHVAANQEKVEENIYILQYLEEKKELAELYRQENYQVEHIISDYEAGYKQLINEIIDNPNDAAKIKAAIAKIVDDYSWTFDMDHRNLFYLFEKKSVLAIMCLLMNEHTRRYYLPIEITEEDGTVKLDTEENRGKARMYKEICSMILTSDFKNALGDHLLRFSGITDGYWKDLEPKGKKCMIIRIEDGDFVRSSGEIGGDLGRDEILEQFIIVDGLDYKSNYSTHILQYMEV